MIGAIILICAVASASSAPMAQYTINVDGPEGRHVQKGEPGKSVSGYFTSRSLDGLIEYKTMYEADENGYRATGDHLPDASATSVAAVRSLEAAPDYVFKYDAPGSHSHYMVGEPGKSVRGSFTYTDGEGRSRRVDYEADENGYRVKPTQEEDKPIEINSQNDAEVIIASETLASVPIPETVLIADIAAEPIAENPVAPTAQIVPDPIPVKVADSAAEVAVESSPEVAFAPANKVVLPEPVADPAPEPVAEPGPESDPAPEPVAEPGPESDPAPEPVAEPGPESDPAPEPGPESDPAPEPLAEPASEPIPVAQTISHLASEPIADPAPEPAPANEPIVEPAPANEPVVEPAPANEPIAEPAPANEPIAEPAPANEPIAEPAPANEPVVDSAPANEPIAEPAPANEPVVEPAPENEPVAEPANDPVANIAPVQQSSVAVKVIELKPQSKAVYDVPISLPRATYYTVPARFVQPALPAFHHVAPYPYGYSVGYPLTGGNYVYSL